MKDDCNLREHVYNKCGPELLSKYPIIVSEGLFLAHVAMCEECSLLHAQANCTFFVHTIERHPNPMHEWKRRWAPIHWTKLQRDARAHTYLFIISIVYLLFIMCLCVYSYPSCIWTFLLFLLFYWPDKLKIKRFLFSIFLPLFACFTDM